MTHSAGSLDANVLLRLILDDVGALHDAAIRLLESQPAKFSVADTAIIEIAFVLERHYRFTRADSAEAIEGLMTLAEINCNRELFSRALPIYKKHRHLSFEDCCLAIYADLNDAKPLWTFDRKLAVHAPHTKLVPIA